MGEKHNRPFQLSFNGLLKIDFQGSRITSDGGLILVRELDERLGLSELIGEHLTDHRGPTSRLAGYEDLNDAIRRAVCLEAWCGGLRRCRCLRGRDWLPANEDLAQDGRGTERCARNRLKNGQLGVSASREGQRALSWMPRGAACSEEWVGGTRGGRQVYTDGEP